MDDILQTNIHDIGFEYDETGMQLFLSTFNHEISSRPGWRERVRFMDVF